jgi:cobalt-precorrin 5A hydrolase
MRVAGLGFRGTAGVASLADALARALASASPATPTGAQAGAQAGSQAGLGPVDALASAHDKAGAPAIRDLAARLALPVLAVAVAGVPTPTQSARVRAHYGTGSLAEAAALAALGPGARLVAHRVASQDGMATCAIAEGDPA